MGQLSPRLGPADGARIAEHLFDAVGWTKDDIAQGKLAGAIGSFSQHLKPANAARVAKRLTDALEHSTNTEARSSLAAALGLLAERMDPAQAAQLREGTIKTLVRPWQSESRTNGNPVAIANSISLMLPYIDAERTNRLAVELCSLSVADADYTASGDDSVPEIVRILNSLLPDTNRSGQALDQFPLAASATDSLGASGAVASLVRWAARTPRCRLTVQQLVDLLKMPTCYGPARRVVLDHLGYIHGRWFLNHWAFVRFARETGLQVDLTTPPKRPDPRASLRRLLDP